MDDLLVQREIVIKIKGPEKLADAMAQRVMMESPLLFDANAERTDGNIRWSVACRKDFLDRNWNVIPPETIAAALRKVGVSGSRD